MFDEIEEEKACAVNSGETPDVYDHIERLTRELLRSKSECGELIDQVRKQTEAIEQYQQSNISLRFQLSHLEEYAKALGRRTMWQRITNSDPTF